MNQECESFHGTPDNISPDHLFSGMFYFPSVAQHSQLCVSPLELLHLLNFPACWTVHGKEKG